MSAIYKLSIQGIRSFDSNDRETIEFGRPLTLIVGANGSGKTTVIECLKYATTGDLPPNSKGGAFVHDPKITGEKDIRAQVKLAFNSANGLNMIVTRNIQLLVKKTTSTFKTLEGQLVAINKNGERSTLSTRAAELDAQVPLYMGVPKAILEYVIFCHQEDSLWPLSEPANLKKKFDEIFQAMKFTKALDNLKAIKKEMSVDIKLLKQSVEHLKVDRNRSRATKLNITQLQRKIEEYQQEVKSIEKQLQAITEKSDKLFSSNQDFQKTLSKLETLQRNKESLIAQITRLKDSIELIDLPKAELTELLDNFSKTLQDKEEEVRIIELEVAKLKQVIEQKQNECDSLNRLQGELNAKKNMYLENKERIKEMKSELSQLYNLPLIENNNEFLQSALHFKDTTIAELEDYAAKNQAHLDKLTSEISNIQQTITIQEQQKQYSITDKDKLSNDIARLRNELVNLDFTTEDFDREKAALTKFTTKLNDWESDNGIARINSLITEKINQVNATENNVEKLQDRISKTNQQSDLFAKLALIKQSMQEKEKALAQVEEQFSKYPKAAEWGLHMDSNIGVDFNSVYLKLQKNIGTSTKNVLLKNQAYLEAQVQLSNTESSISKHEKLVDDLRTKIQAALPEDCNIDEYDDILVETELSYRTALENLKMHQTTLEFNKKALEVAEHDNCCYLCSRPFDTAEFKSQILEELKSKTDENFEASLKHTVQEEKQYLDELRKLEKDYMALNNSRDKIKATKVTVSDLSKTCANLKSEFDRAQEEADAIRDDRELAEKDIRPLVELFTRVSKEKKDLQNDINTISDELKVYGNFEDGAQTIDELQTAQKEASELLKVLRKEIDKLRSEKEDKLKEQANLMNLVKQRDHKVRDMEQALLRSKSIEEDISKKQKEVATLQSRLENFTENISNSISQRSNIEAEYKKLKTDFDKTFEDKRAVSDKIARYVDGLHDLQRQINDFELNGTKHLEKCTSDLVTARNELETNKEIIQEKTDSLNILTQKLHDSSNEEKNLRYNIDLIDLQANLKKVEKDIDELDIQNAEAERDKYQQESQRLRAMFERLSSENAGKMGEIKQLQNQIDSLSHQLRTDYKNVDDQYDKEWVQLQTKSFVSDDIDTYSKALDSAIMKYHSLKMQDINRIIDELWTRTYSGTDIDTIRIRSDEVSNTVKGKSYNYRVVMYKQDAELDMRGRCSAGQKVLASIIIRLALSETFGANCGVIALDEPTTNLDEENIESLAKSLNNIIQFRQHQKNFQLIVITHDEHFLNNMNAAQFTDHFFKVKRDDRQKSLIEWIDINRVTE